MRMGVTSRTHTHVHTYAHTHARAHTHTHDPRAAFDGGTACLLLLVIAAVEGLVGEVVLAAKGGDFGHVISSQRIGLSIIARSILRCPLLPDGRVSAAARFRLRPRSASPHGRDTHTKKLSYTE